MNKWKNRLLMIFMVTAPLFYWVLMDGVIFQNDVVDSFSKKNYDFSSVETSFGDIPFDGMRPFSRIQFEENLVKLAPAIHRKNLSKVLSETLLLSEWYRVDPFWILAIMWTESRYDNSSQSPKGALGVMQIMPDTGKYLSYLLSRNNLLSGGHDQSQCGEVVDLPYASFSFANGENGQFFPAKNNVRNKILNPAMNIEMGIIYLKCLLKIFNNDPELATMAYNLGPNRIKEFLNIRQYRNDDPDEMLLTFTSKSRYLKKVKAAYEQLSHPFRNYFHYL